MFLGSRKRKSGHENGNDVAPYVSKLQKDVGKYVGWSREEVESDFYANKSVHTIVVIGYLEYNEDVLTLTDKGRLLMRNVQTA